MPHKESQPTKSGGETYRQQSDLSSFGGHRNRLRRYHPSDGSQIIADLESAILLHINQNSLKGVFIDLVLHNNLFAIR